jgi:hypothetical protein
MNKQNTNVIGLLSVCTKNFASWKTGFIKNVKTHIIVVYDGVYDGECTASSHAITAKFGCQYQAPLHAL